MPKVSNSRKSDTSSFTYVSVRGIILFVGCVCLLACLICPDPARCMTAQQVLEEVIKQNFLDSFRVVLDVQTFKGKRSIAKSTLWLMGRAHDRGQRFFSRF